MEILVSLAGTQSQQVQNLGGKLFYNLNIIHVTASSYHQPLSYNVNHYTLVALQLVRDLIRPFGRGGVGGRQEPTVVFHVISNK